MLNVPDGVRLLTTAGMQLADEVLREPVFSLLGTKHHESQMHDISVQ